MASMELTSAEISDRLPVWEAISELWLDTELGEGDLRFIAERLARSKYGLSELEDIYLLEVAPVVHGNLRQPAGTWTGFDREWLRQAVLSHLAKRDHRAVSRLRRAYMTQLVADQWRDVMRFVEALRRSTPEA